MFAAGGSVFADCAAMASHSAWDRDTAPPHHDDDSNDEGEVCGNGGYRRSRLRGPRVRLVLPRRFALVRHIDYTGVSGIGVVAYGTAFPDGHVALRWCSTHPATSIWSSLEDLLAVHGHNEATIVEWIDPPSGALDELDPQASGRAGRRVRQPEPDPAETDIVSLLPKPPSDVQPTPQRHRPGRSPGRHRRPAATEANDPLH